MDEANEKPIWDKRLPGEPSEAFDLFQIYLSIGPQRTYADAVRAYLSTPGKAGRDGGVRKKTERQQQKYRTHAQPDRYVNDLASSWRRHFALRWDWEHRADLYDAFHEALAAEKRDIERQRMLAERREELAQQRTLMEQEARSMRESARQLFVRFLEGVKAEHIKGMDAKALIPHLHRAAAVMEAGQKLFRVALGEPSDITAQAGGGDSALISILAEILQRRLGADQFEEIAADIEQIAADIRRRSRQPGGAS